MFHIGDISTIYVLLKVSTIVLIVGCRKWSIFELWRNVSIVQCVPAFFFFFGIFSLFREETRNSVLRQHPVGDIESSLCVRKIVRNIHGRRVRKNNVSVICGKSKVRVAWSCRYFCGNSNIRYNSREYTLLYDACWHNIDIKHNFKLWALCESKCIFSSRSCSPHFSNPNIECICAKSR